MANKDSKRATIAFVLSGDHPERGTWGETYQLRFDGSRQRTADNFRKIVMARAELLEPPVYIRKVNDFLWQMAGGGLPQGTNPELWEYVSTEVDRARVKSTDGGQP